MDILILIIVAIFLFFYKKNRKEQEGKTNPRKNNYSIVYFCVTLLLLLLFIFVPINKDGIVINTVTCAQHFNDFYGGYQLLFWFLFFTEIPLVIGMILSACNNNYIVKSVRIILNIAVIGSLSYIMVILDDWSFDIGVGSLLLMIISVIDLILAIAMAFPNKEKNRWQFPDRK